MAASRAATSTPSRPGSTRRSIRTTCSTASPRRRISATHRGGRRSHRPAAGRPRDLHRRGGVPAAHPAARAPGTGAGGRAVPRGRHSRGGDRDTDVRTPRPGDRAGASGADGAGAARGPAPRLYPESYRLCGRGRSWRSGRTALPCGATGSPSRRRSCATSPRSWHPDRNGNREPVTGNGRPLPLPFPFPVPCSLFPVPVPRSPFPAVLPQPLAYGETRTFHGWSSSASATSPSPAFGSGISTACVTVLYMRPRAVR